MHSRAPRLRERLETGSRLAVSLPSSRRLYGGQQPHIPLGPFRVRIPLIHHELEVPELLQGLFLAVTGLAGAALLEDVYGASFALATTFVFFQAFGYYFHQLLGDTMVAGWLTPAVPLVLGFLLKYPMGPERIQAQIALQLELGLLFLILGWTGMAKRLVQAVPSVIKAGIVLGAGIAALIGKYGFAPDGLVLTKYRLSFLLGMPVVLYFLYSANFRSYARQQKRGLARTISLFGMVPGLIAIGVAGLLTREVPLPKFESVALISLRLDEMIRGYSILGVGVPDLSKFIAAIPVVFAIYIIAFGEIVLGEETMKSASQARPDEDIGYDSNRLNLVCGVRNTLQALFSPFPGLSGPNWAAMSIAITERYKQGVSAVYSLVGAAASFNLAKAFATMIVPLMLVFAPFREPMLGMSMILQGFACGVTAMGLAKTTTEFGIACIMACLIATMGIAYGLGVGVILYLLLMRSWIKAPITSSH